MLGGIRKCSGIPVITVESSQERHQEIILSLLRNALTRFLKNGSAGMASHLTIGSPLRRNSGVKTIQTPPISRSLLIVRRIRT